MPSRATVAALAIPALLFVFHETKTRAVPADATARSGSLRAVAPMLEPRSGHAAVLLANGNVLLVGGMRRNQDFYKSAELFDPATQKFAATGSLALARVGPAAVRLPSGKVLVVGGWSGHATTDSAEMYDPTSGKFSDAGRMTAKRGRPEATLLPTGDVLIAGGSDSDAPSGVATAELFHPATGKFEAVGSMHAGRVSHSMTLLRDGRVLVAGGRGEEVNASAEIYDPMRKAFALTGSMITPRYKHAAGVLPDGRVVVAGGSGPLDWKGQLASAEIYDPKSGTFSATGPLSDARYKLPDEAPALPDGSLLFAGGSATMDVYEPATGTFVALADHLPDARHFMTETKLADGGVLLTGGYVTDDRATDAAYIYQPQ